VIEIATKFYRLDEGSPWAESNPEGRLVYVVRFPGGLFAAHGVHGPSRTVVFAARGETQQELETFVKRMEAEGATVRVKQGPFDPPKDVTPPPGTAGMSSPSSPDGSA
jgi:hypothetical protein